jgi:hypothetical protein
MFSEFHKRKKELTENSSFRLFAANGKTETANFCLFAENGNRGWKFVFLGGQMINGNQRLLFQPTMMLRPIFKLSDTRLNPKSDCFFVGLKEN